MWFSTLEQNAVIFSIVWMMQERSMHSMKVAFSRMQQDLDPLHQGESYSPAWAVNWEDLPCLAADINGLNCLPNSKRHVPNKIQRSEGGASKEEAGSYWFAQSMTVSRAFCPSNPAGHWAAMCQFHKPPYHQQSKNSRAFGRRLFGPLPSAHQTHTWPACAPKAP